MDKNKIVMIAPVAVAAILMLGILAAAGNAQESSNTSSSQETSKTGNGATSPTSSQETNKTGNGATSPTSSQESSNGKKPTELTLSATQTGPAKNEANETKDNVKFSGRLTSEGSGVAGATIAIDCDGNECVSADTDSGGHYSVGTELSESQTYVAGELVASNNTHEIFALTEHIPSGYEKSNATTTIQLR